MNNRWTVVTLGIAALGATSLTSTLTTAYLMRPPAPEASAEPAVPEPTPVRRPAIVEISPARPAAARRQPPTLAGHRAPDASDPHAVTATSPVAAAAASAPGSQSAPVVVVVPSPASRPPDGSPNASQDASRSTTPAPATASTCEGGAERAWRIAKPGLVGSVLGAGVGAAGGAIANGGKGAGKGALIGGLAGAAAGAGYGAYKTKDECGTILGSGGASPSSARSPASSPGPDVVRPPAP